MLKKEGDKWGGKCEMRNENISFFDEMFNALVVELKKRIRHRNIQKIWRWLWKRRWGESKDRQSA